MDSVEPELLLRFFYSLNKFQAAVVNRWLCIDVARFG